MTVFPARSQSSPVLSGSGITVRFGGLTALASVDIEVPAASVVGLVGPNGAGKTTLFAVLSGLLRPDSGTVSLNGADVTTASIERRARMGLARTFQHTELFTDLTVREHLLLAARMRMSPGRLWSDLVRARSAHSLTSSEEGIVQEILGLLDLDGLAHMHVHGLPLGSCRLVEVGRALATRPSVLLLDEPTSGLDSGETDRLTEALARVVADQNLSVLLVEHDVDMVLRLSNQVVVLDFGAVICTGTPEQIRSDAKVRAAYLGDEPLPSDGQVGA